MSKLTFTFQQGWLQEKKRQFGSPVRSLERLIREVEQAKLVKSGHDSLTVELPEGERAQLVERVLKLLETDFHESAPAGRLVVEGDVEGLDLPVPPPPEENDPLEEFLDDIPDESGVADPIQQARPPQQPAQQGEVHLEQRVEQFCEGPPMRFSPPLADYLREVAEVVPMLGRMGAMDCVWAQNLLVAIDGGCGFSAFAEALRKVYALCGVAGKKPEVRHVVIGKNKGEDTYAGWKAAVDAAGRCGGGSDRQSHVILALDVRKWQSELDTPEVRDYLRQLEGRTGRLICMFRTSFMEPQALSRVAQSLAGLIPVRALMVAPVPVPHMRAYLREQVEGLHCQLAEGCDELLEQWILREKGAGGFNGYKSLENMAKELVLHKALRNCREEEWSHTITPEDVAACLGDGNQLEDPYALLGRLVGLEQIKQRIREMVVQIKAQKELAAHGSALERPAIHMMFTGSPGTGKTTVARLLARIMKQEGVLSKGLLIEVRGRDLCGRYVGETAPKTAAYCRDAYGSVLFIDEAYSLYQRDMGRDFGKEALATLVAEMENHRDDFCVILAGYRDEMKEMLEGNPGLESRIPYVVDFPSYSREELEEIFFRMMEGKLPYENDLRETVRDLFSSIPQRVMEEKSFSNARLARSLFERSWGKAACRRSLTGEETLTILKEDVYAAFEEDEFKKLVTGGEGKRTIGFSR